MTPETFGDIEELLSAANRRGNYRNPVLLKKNLGVYYRDSGNGSCYSILGLCTDSGNGDHDSILWLYRDNGKENCTVYSGCKSRLPHCFRSTHALRVRGTWQVVPYNPTCHSRTPVLPIVNLLTKSPDPDP